MAVKEEWEEKTQYISNNPPDFTVCSIVEEVQSDSESESQLLYD
jgi:hypothetical protein